MSSFNPKGAFSDSMFVVNPYLYSLWVTSARSSSSFCAMELALFAFLWKNAPSSQLPTRGARRFDLHSGRWCAWVAGAVGRERFSLFITAIPVGMAQAYLD